MHIRLNADADEGMVLGRLMMEVGVEMELAEHYSEGIYSQVFLMGPTIEVAVMMTHGSYASNTSSQSTILKMIH